MARPNPRTLCINDVLPRDLLTEVFLRIDSVDLFRCKSVCKLWLSCTDHDPDFVARFILLRSKEPPPWCEDEDYDGRIYVEWTPSEMVLFNPTWYCLTTPEFSFDFLPNHRGRSDPFDIGLSYTVVGSSNGLLLVSNFGSSPDRYCICNPITKQWLELPPFSPCSTHNDVQVGFITDPFYDLRGNNGSVSVNGAFCAKVVRLDFTRYNGDENEREIDAEVFLSHSGCWTSFRVQLPDYVTDKVDKFRWGRMIPYKGSLYWLIEDEDEDSEILVYDTNKNEFLMDRIRVFPSSPVTYTFKGISRCRNLLWVAEVSYSRLRVYTLLCSVWVLMHDVDVVDGMQCSSSSVKECSGWILHDAIDSVTMHPNNFMIAYVSVSNMLLECDFGSRTVTPIIEVVSPDGGSPSWREYVNDLVHSLLVIVDFAPNSGCDVFWYVVDGEVKQCKWMMLARMLEPELEPKLKSSTAIFISPIPEFAAKKNLDSGDLRSFPPVSISVEDWVRLSLNCHMAGRNSRRLCINDVLLHDLLTEVFLRIDSVDLFRCKSVCKLWLSSTDHDPDFVARFILLRSKEPPPWCEDEDYDGRIYVKWTPTETILFNPTWYCLSAPEFTFDFLPNHSRLSDPLDISLSYTVVGSSNGLLLVSGFGSSRDRYCICNPITRQWLELPPFTRCSRGNDVQVGFITDPFYDLRGNNGSVSVNDGFCAKVVRLDFTRYHDEEIDHEIDVEVFSSHSGRWTSFRVQLPDYVIGKLDPLQWGAMIPYEGSLYWLIEDEEGHAILVYDTNKNEFLMDHLGFFPSSPVTYKFKGISRCQNSLWVAEDLFRRLRVYTLVGSVWVLMYDVDIIDGVQWRKCSSSSVNECTSWIPHGVDFFTMHPTNIMLAYISVANMLLECDFGRRTVTPITEVVGPDGKPWLEESTFLLPICLPLWPTPLPLLPNA
ncbi:hypothetical protein LINGRAHAP2_LOCUS36461 [Linum grandiflorum]